MRVLLMLLMPALLCGQTIVVRHKVAGGGGGGASASDDFAGSAGALTGNWTNLTAYLASRDGSGYAVCGTNFQSCIARWTGATFAANQYAEVVIGDDLTGSDRLGTGVHIGTSGEGYYLYRSGASKYISIGVRGTTGSPVQLVGSAGCSNTAVTAGDTIRLAVSGTVLTAYKNGSAVSGCTYNFGSDGTQYPTGAPGIYVGRAGGNNTKLDSFAAADL